MTRKLFAMVATLALAASLARAGDREVFREQSDEILDARGVRALVVTNPRGLISVKRGSGTSVRLTALKVVTGGDEAHARQLAALAQVRVGVEGGNLVVRVLYPQHRQIEIGFWDLLKGADIPRVELRLAFELPAHLALTLKSASGDLVTSGVSGAQALESASGDIEVGEAGAGVRATSVSGDVSLTGIGTAQVSTVSGDIRIENATGPVAMTTTSGDVAVGKAGDSVTVTSVSGEIQVDGAKGGLKARTTSGDIEARASGKVAVETASGEARVTLEAPLAGAVIGTVSGDIRLHLGGDLGCAFEARTASGAIDLLVPLDVRSISRQYVSGVVRGGRTPVALHSSSGDIHVED